MNKNIKKQVVMRNYRKMKSEIRKTGIFQFLDGSDLKKQCDCEFCVVGDKPDCIFCLLPDYNIRLALKEVLKNKTLKSVEMYQDVLLLKAQKHNSQKLERLNSIIEASLSF